jgi:hypothetical protein
MKTSLLIFLILLTIANAGEQIPDFLSEADSVEYVNIGRAHKEPRIVEKYALLNLLKKHAAIVLDTRDKKDFEQLHVKGAVNLPFEQLSRSSLARLIPTKDTAIVIHDPNNMRRKASDQVQEVDPSWNYQVSAVLRIYGYTDIYALDPEVHLRSIPNVLVGDIH